MIHIPMLLDHPEWPGPASPVNQQEARHFRWAEMEEFIESTNVSEFQLRILELISGGLGGTYQLYV